MEQSQQILDEVRELRAMTKKLADHVAAQNGRIKKLERYTQIPPGYKGDGTDKYGIGVVVRHEMADALRDFFSLARIGSYLGVIAILVSIVNTVLGWF